MPTAARSPSSRWTRSPEPRCGSRVNHVAWVLCAFRANGPDALAGIGRVIRYPDKPATADVAVTVADDWQGKGVASALVEVLERHPLEGVTTIETEITDDDQAARPAPPPRRHRRAAAVDTVDSRDGF